MDSKFNEQGLRRNRIFAQSQKISPKYISNKGENNSLAMEELNRQHPLTTK